MNDLLVTKGPALAVCLGDVCRRWRRDTRDETPRSPADLAHERRGGAPRQTSKLVALTRERQMRAAKWCFILRYIHTETILRLLPRKSINLRGRLVMNKRPVNVSACPVRLEMRRRRCRGFGKRWCELRQVNTFDRLFVFVQRRGAPEDRGQHDNRRRGQQ